MSLMTVVIVLCSAVLIIMFKDKLMDYFQEKNANKKVVEAEKAKEVSDAKVADANASYESFSDKLRKYREKK